PRLRIVVPSSSTWTCTVFAPGIPPRTPLARTDRRAIPPRVRHDRSGSAGAPPCGAGFLLARLWRMPRRTEAAPPMKTRPGIPYPLGATWDGDGVNFALYSEHAAGVDVCLFDENGVERRVPLRERTAFVWHGYVPGVRPGAQYGFRVKGEYAPEKGLRFN